MLGVASWLFAYCFCRLNTHLVLSDMLPQRLLADNPRHKVCCADVRACGCESYPAHVTLDHGSLFKACAYHITASHANVQHA